MTAWLNGKFVPAGRQGGLKIDNRKSKIENVLINEELGVDDDKGKGEGDGDEKLGGDWD